MHGSQSGWTLFLLLTLGGPLACEVAPVPGTAPSTPPASGDTNEAEPPEALQTSAIFEATLREEATPARGGLKPVERLGKLLFFDRRLSEPAGQACAVCHVPEVGWTGPNMLINITGSVYEGAVAGTLRQSQAALVRLCDAVSHPPPGDARAG